MKKIIATLGFALMLLGTQANAMGLFYTNATYPVTATGMKNQDIIRILNMIPQPSSKQKRGRNEFI